MVSITYAHTHTLSLSLSHTHTHAFTHSLMHSYMLLCGVHNTHYLYDRDVSNDAMREDDISGLWRLHVLTSLVALLPLSLLFLLPHNEKDQEQLSKSKERSKIGGVVFLTVLTGSLLWTLTTSSMTLYGCYNDL